MDGTGIDTNASHGIVFTSDNAKTYARIRAFAKGNGGQAVWYQGQPAFKDIVVTPT